MEGGVGNREGGPASREGLPPLHRPRERRRGEDAELVYPLQSSGEEVPLRIRTERFETNEEGALTANGATLTTCDHDVPHYVVRTRLFRLEPRRGGGWRFAARGNQLKFDNGFQLPLPSISSSSRTTSSASRVSRTRPVR